MPPVEAGPSSAALPTLKEKGAVEPGRTTADAGPLSSAAAAAIALKSFPVAEVKVRDVLVLRLKLTDGGLVPAERAKRATRAIEAALVEGAVQTVRTEMRQDRALLFVGPRPIVELTRADAEALGEGSLELFATSAAEKIRDLLDSERRQSVVMKTLLNLAIVGALAYGVVIALRLLSNLARKIQHYIHQNPERIPAIRLQSIEVIGPPVLRSTFLIGIGVTKLFFQFALVYTWIVFASSRFDVTNGLASRLTSLVLSPVAGLMTRLAALLPLLLVIAIAAAGLFVVLRFVELFFIAVHRKETELTWLKPELAAPTSLLIRIGAIVLSLLFLGPVVTGSIDGALTRLGMLCVVTVAAASIPLLANSTVALLTLYGSRFSEGDTVEFYGLSKPVLRGRIKKLGLLELTMLSDHGHEVRIAYLTTLLRPISVIAPGAHRSAHILVVEAKADPLKLVESLNGFVESERLAATVHLTKITADFACAELRSVGESEVKRQAILVGVARALSAANLSLVLAEWQDPP